MPINKRTSLRKGMLLNWLGLGISFGVSFIVTPIIIRTLGAAGFGMWALIQSFSGYYGLVNLGLTSALQRNLGKDLAIGNTCSLQTTVSTSLLFFSCTGALVLLAAAIFAQPAAGFFGIESAATPSFVLTLLLCGTAVVLDFFNGLATAMFTASERFDLLNALSIGRQLAQTSGILFVLWYQPTINGLASVVCLISALTLIISWWRALRLYPDIKVTWRASTLSRLKELLHYGSSTVMLRISNLIRLRVGNLIIARTVGVAAVAQFSIASNLVLNMNSIIDATMRVLTPRFTRLDAQSNVAEMQQLYRTALFGSSLMAGGMGLMIVVFGQRFILFWVGPDYLLSAKILKILGLAFVVNLAQAPQWNLMFAQAKHHFMSRVTTVESVAILLLGLWLTQSHGAIGFTWGTAIAMLVVKLTVTPINGARIAGLKLSEYLAPMTWPILSAAVLCGAALAIDLEAILRNHGLILFLGLAAGVGAAYLGLVCLLARHAEYMPAVISRYFPASWRTA